jgi:hypothetical protein
MTFKKSLTLSFLLAVFSSLFAQKEFEDINYNSQTISHAEYSERIEFTDNDKIVKTNPDLEYTWLKNQTVLTTQGGYSGKLLHGNYESFYPNNNLMGKGKFSYGLKDGTWLYWREDGTLKTSEYWKNGQKEKDVILFNSSGVDSLIIPYKKDQKHGKVYEVFNNHKKHVQTYKKGVLKSDKINKVQSKWFKRKDKSDSKLEKENLTREEKKANKKTKKKEAKNNKEEKKKNTEEKKTKKNVSPEKEDSTDKTKRQKEDKKGLLKRLFKKDKSEKD